MHYLNLKMNLISITDEIIEMSDDDDNVDINSEEISETED